jgi:hypothetical protein
MMTSDAKRALAKTIHELREKIILPDLREATERAYQLAIDAKKATLSEAARTKRARIEARLDEQTRAVAAKARPEAKQRLFGELIKDAGATLLQRLVYLRLLETNGLRTVPIVTGGWDSRGYKDFARSSRSRSCPTSRAVRSVTTATATRHCSRWYSTSWHSICPVCSGRCA